MKNKYFKITSKDIDFKPHNLEINYPYNIINIECRSTFWDDVKLTYLKEINKDYYFKVEYPDIFHFTNENLIIWLPKEVVDKSNFNWDNIKIIEIEETEYVIV